VDLPHQTGELNVKGSWRSFDPLYRSPQPMWHILYTERASLRRQHPDQVRTATWRRARVPGTSTRPPRPTKAISEAGSTQNSPAGCPHIDGTVNPATSDSRTDDPRLPVKHRSSVLTEKRVHFFHRERRLYCPRRR